MALLNKCKQELIYNGSIEDDDDYIGRYGADDDDYSIEALVMIVIMMNVPNDDNDSDDNDDNDDDDDDDDDSDDDDKSDDVDVDDDDVTNRCIAFLATEKVNFESAQEDG